MPRKKITEPESMAQTTGMEMAGLTEETADAAAVSEEGGFGAGFPSDAPEELSPDAMPEGEAVPAAAEVEVAGVELLPSDAQESLPEEVPTKPPPASESLPRNRRQNSRPPLFRRRATGRHSLI